MPWYHLRAMFGPGSQSTHEDYMWSDAPLTKDQKEDITQEWCDEHSLGYQFSMTFTEIGRPPQTYVNRKISSIVGGINRDVERATAKLQRFTQISPDVYQRGDFTLASGRKTRLKIECDAHTDEELATFVEMARPILTHPDFRRFVRVEGVPEGGLRFAKLLSYKREYKTTGKGDVGTLVVDDVMTTGGSVLKYIDKLVKKGRSIHQISVLVIHYRNPDPMNPGHPKLVYGEVPVPCYALNIVNVGADL